MPFRKESSSRPTGRQWMAQLLDAAPDGIIQVDRDGLILFANAAATRLFGYSADELTGLSVDSLVPQELRPGHGKRREGYMERPVTRPMGVGLELRAERKDGSSFPVEISLSPMRAGDTTVVVAIVRDITERKQIEAQINSLKEQFTREVEQKNLELEQRNKEVERASRLKSEFLASMSHELRSPLHTIIGFSELLAEGVEGTLTEKQQRFVRNIHEDSQHLLAIINDLLDISKIEAGRMEFHRERFDLHDAVEEAALMMRSQAENKALELEVRAPAGAWIEADRLRFKQVLLNLLSNAVKFTPDGGHIGVSAAVRPGRILVSVSDTGVGIAEQDEEAIFDKFYQVGSTTKGVREGTGLGLAITKKLVEEQGGVIWVRSEPGRGSVFTFTVPGSWKDPVRRADRPLVLVVESKPHAAELLGNYLSSDGIDTFYTRAMRGWALIAKEILADAIVIDRDGAAEDGFLGGLRGDPATHGIPVISVSAADGAGVALDGVVQLTKPVSRQKLLESLKTCLKPREKRDVLVVEDEPLAREVIEEVLRDAGYNPRMAANPAAAFEILETGRLAAVVLDLKLPSMSGVDLLARIRENPEWRSLPVVVLTGIELDGDQKDALRQMAATVLTKGESWKRPLLDRLRESVRAQAGASGT